MSRFKFIQASTPISVIEVFNTIHPTHFFEISGLVVVAMAFHLICLSDLTEVVDLVELIKAFHQAYQMGQIKAIPIEVTTMDLIMAITVPWATRGFNEVVAVHMIAHIKVIMVSRVVKVNHTEVIEVSVQFEATPANHTMIFAIADIAKAITITEVAIVNHTEIVAEIK